MIFENTVNVTIHGFFQKRIKNAHFELKNRVKIDENCSKKAQNIRAFC